MLTVPMIPSHDMSQKKLILLDLSAQSMTGEERKREGGGQMEGRRVTGREGKRQSERKGGTVGGIRK